MPNPYFDSLAQQESPLYNDLIRETIFNHGIGAKYLIRDNFNVDDILGRMDGAFNKAFDIDVVIKDAQNFDEQSHLYNNFGLQIDKSVTFITHKDEFKRITNNEPKKGDVIYLKQWDLLFEILEPATLNVLQFGDSYAYTLYCKVFESRGEEFTTNDPDIDKSSDIFSDNLTTEDTTAIEERFNNLVQFSEDNPFAGNF